MAKLERHLTTEFTPFVSALNSAILHGSASATLEDASDYTLGDVNCAVRVYERYSYMGGNRVSLNVTVLGKGRNVYLTAITSGGSQAVFFKINTLGESAFLDKVSEFLNKYPG